MESENILTPKQLAKIRKMFGSESPTPFEGFLEETGIRLVESASQQSQSNNPIPNDTANNLQMLKVSVTQLEYQNEYLKNELEKANKQTYKLEKDVLRSLNILNDKHKVIELQLAELLGGAYKKVNTERQGPSKSNPEKGPTATRKALASHPMGNENNYNSSRRQPKDTVSMYRPRLTEAENHSQVHQPGHP